MGPTVELYVRSLSPAAAGGRQERVVDRLDRLTSAGHVEDFEIRVWGREVGVEGATAAAESVLDRVEAFRAWADARGAELPFRRRAVATPAASGEALRLPTMALAEYLEGEASAPRERALPGDLVSVAPREEDGALVTVRDRLDALASEDERAGTPLVRP